MHEFGLVFHLLKAASVPTTFRGATAMKKNMGAADRIIRIAIVIGIAVAYFTGALSGTLAIVLGVVAVAFLLTSLVSMCPLYSLLGISSSSRSERS
jgi:uncharacterized membrane protein YkgB